MGQQLRTDIPVTKDSLTPDWPFLEQFRGEDRKFKRCQKENYDRRHRTRSLPDIPQGTDVWINTGGHSTERVSNPHTTAPRSYTVTTANGTLHRNRSHLNVVPPSVQTATSSDQAISDPSNRGPIMTRSRTGTPIQNGFEQIPKGRCSMTAFSTLYMSLCMMSLRVLYLASSVNT